MMVGNGGGKGGPTEESRFCTSGWGGGKDNVSGSRWSLPTSKKRKKSKKLSKKKGVIRSFQDEQEKFHVYGDDGTQSR